MVAAQKHQAAIQQLGVTHLFACVLLLTVVIAASHALRLDLAGRLVVSASRCAVQLLILCAFVLEPLFGRNDPKLIVAYLSLIVALAAKEASSRLKYGYAGLRLHFAAAFACGAGSVILYAAVFVCVESTSALGAPDNSSLSHFSAIMRPSWLCRAVRNWRRHTPSSRRRVDGVEDGAMNAL